MMRKILALGALLLLLPAAAAQAAVYTGAMDNRANFPAIPGFVAQSQAWATGGAPGGGLRLEWQADDETNPGLWTYTYRLIRDNAKSKGFAFFDIETASDFSAANLKSTRVVSATDRFGVSIPSGLAAITIRGPAHFNAVHDFSNAPVTEADFNRVLDKADLSHYSGDPGRVAPGQPGAKSSATASVGPVPHPFYGIRVSFPGSFFDLGYEACAWEFSIVSDRVPMWGSFFGWGDQTAVPPYWYANVYNSHIDAPERLALAPADSPAGAGPYRGWLLVPGSLPGVISVIPADGGTVAVSGPISAVFSGAMDASTITAASFTVSGVTGTVNYDPATRSATFTPAFPLSVGTSYSASISTAVRDLAGNPLPAPKSWSFVALLDGLPLPDGILIPGEASTSIGDALKALRIAVGLVLPTPEEARRGDVAPLGPDGRPRPDGKIDIQDALTILRKAVGLLNW